MSVEIAARAGTLPQAFVEAALGLFAVALDLAAVRAHEIREVRAHGASQEALLARWIEECHYVHEIEGFTCRSIDMAVFDTEARIGGEPMRLHAFLHGEEMDADRHGTATAIRAVSFDEAPIRSVPGGYEIRLTVEI